MEKVEIRKDDQVGIFDKNGDQISKGVIWDITKGRGNFDRLIAIELE